MDNLRAIGLMIAAMASFAVADLFIKLAADTLSSAEIVLWSGLLGALAFAGLTLRAGQSIVTPLFFHRAVLLRNMAEIVGTVCIVSALTLAPLSLVAAITQATPLAVSAGAALFLRERVGPLRWLAVLVGLAGVLLILRPGAAPLSTGALFAVGAVLGLAARDVLTRLVPPGITTLQLATYGFGVLVPAGAILVALTAGARLPGAVEVALLLGITAGAALAYYAITAAMRLGEASLVAPFRYTRLIFALAIAVLFLGERPDAATLVGAAIVIGSGLVVLLRERRPATGGISRPGDSG